MVEIFREPELEEMIGDKEISKAWKKEVEDLGLSGQVKLTSSSEDSSPSIYTFMNSSMTNTFKVLCGMSTDYKTYDKSTIPLEVLKEISLCVHEKYFHKIEIWYDDLDPDPICVGFTTEKYDSPKHIIARWGDEILPLTELRVKAKTRLLNHVVSQYKKMELALEHAVDKHINGEYASLSINFSNSSGFDLPF